MNKQSGIHEYLQHRVYLDLNLAWYTVPDSTHGFSTDCTLWPGSQECANCWRVCTEDCWLWPGPRYQWERNVQEEPSGTVIFIHIRTITLVPGQPHHMCVSIEDGPLSFEEGHWIQPLLSHKWSGSTLRPLRSYVNTLYCTLVRAYYMYIQYASCPMSRNIG